jgi:hypothetical protein
MASWNWEMNLLEEPCPGLNQKKLAMATKGKVSTMVCFANIEEVVGNHIVNAIAFDKLKATVMETTSMEERVTRRVEK